MISILGQMGAITKSVHHMPENAGEHCNIFWPVGPLYDVLKHFKVHIVHDAILWPVEALYSVSHIAKSEISTSTLTNQSISLDISVRPSSC